MSCPMQNKPQCTSEMSPAYETSASEPLSTIIDDANGCPVGFDRDNQSYSNDQAPIGGGVASLPVQRKVSSIPRSSEKEEYWVYPSQQQFYNSMKRKNFEPSEDDMSTVVAMHNAVNEMTWHKILKWEQKYSETCGNPTLKKFGGKSEDISPKARIMSWFGYSLPFDRHDWIVDRCGKDVPYIIDFYSGNKDGTNSLVAMHIDARPRLDSFSALYDRVESWFR